MSEESGVILGLWVKRAHRGPMDPAEEVELVADSGIVGNADRGGARQITVIRDEDFQSVSREMGHAVDPALRRANVLVRGVELRRTRGMILHLGPCRIQIVGETVPCERMDEAVPGLRAALRLDWRGGCYGRVLTGGPVRVGDHARVQPEGSRGPR